MNGASVVVFAPQWDTTSKNVAELAGTFTQSTVSNANTMSGTAIGNSIGMGMGLGGMLARIGDFWWSFCGRVELAVAYGVFNERLFL